MKAQTTPRSEGRSRLTRPAPVAGLLATLNPYNPYILPVDRTPKGWTSWGLWALGLSLGATVLWDKAPHVASSKGGFMKAPAQWVSAIVLLAAAVTVVFSIGAPWGALPVVAGAVVAVRRVLVAGGQKLTLDAALAGATRKLVLAGAGIAVWAVAVGLAGWLDGILEQVSKSPLARIGGELGAQSMSGLSTAGERLIGFGGIACLFMVTMAVLWWARDAYLAQMESAPE